MSDPASDVSQALALLKGLSFVMGRRDVAFDKTTKQAVELLEKARASLGAGPAPEVLPGSVEPSIIEWIYSASDNAIRAAELMAVDAQGPTRAEVLSGALLSIREWAARQLPAKAAPAAEEPLRLR